MNCRPRRGPTFRPGAARYQRAFDGRARCADLCAEESGALSVGVGVFADLPSDGLPLGEKALSRYLGADRANLARLGCDRVDRRRAGAAADPHRSGEADGFLAEQNKPGGAAGSGRGGGHPLTLRMQPGYDHSYYFIASFIESHLRHHAQAMAVSVAYSLTRPRRP